MLTADAHMDIPWIIQKYGPRDLRFPSDNSIFTLGGAKAGKLDIGVFALYLSDLMQDSMTGTEVLNALDKQYTAIASQMGLYAAHNAGDAIYLANVASTSTSKNFVALTALEGGRLIGNNLDNLTYFKSSYGIQYLTLLHNRNNSIGGSATDTGNGLTEFGRSVVKHCEAIGVKVDVSHSNDKTTQDVLGISTRPVLATHSGAYGLVRHPRNLAYGRIRAIRDSNGFIGVPFAKRFIGHYSITEHIDEIVSTCGNCNCVGIGSDIDGAEMIGNVTSVEDWKTVVMDELSGAGYSDNDIEKIAGGNLLRVLAS